MRTIWQSALHLNTHFAASTDTSRPWQQHLYSSRQAFRQTNSAHAIINTTNERLCFTKANARHSTTDGHYYTITNQLARAHKNRQADFFRSQKLLSKTTWLCPTLETCRASNHIKTAFCAVNQLPESARPECYIQTQD